MNKADQLAEILAEGLDLCVRARKIDQVLETIPASHPDNDTTHPIVRCATPRVWIQDQYDTDLAEWEARARKLMADLGYG